jgi:hypothetical protein
MGRELQPQVRQAEKDQTAMTLVITAPDTAALRVFAALYRLRGYKLTAVKKTRKGWRIVAWR